MVPQFHKLARRQDADSAVLAKDGQVFVPGDNEVGCPRNVCRQHLVVATLAANRARQCGWPEDYPTVATNPERMILSSWVSNVAPWTRAVATTIRSAGSR